MKSDIILSKTPESLAGKLLIATNVVDDSVFAKSVIYMCAHSASGAMGIIVNYPVLQVELRDIFEHLQIELPLPSEQFKVHFGGPVEAHRGFIVHSTDYETQGSVIAQDGIAVSASLNVLHDLAHGRGPKKGMLVLGYAGWAARQLESEIETGSWIVVPATSRIVFDTKNETKWEAAVSTLGFDLGHFSSQVGHA